MKALNEALAAGKSRTVAREGSERVYDELMEAVREAENVVDEAEIEEAKKK